MKRIPAKLSILGAPYRVRVIKMEDHGSCCGSKREILLNRADDIETQHETLLHEVVHAILFESGQSDMLSEERAESLTVAICHGMWSSGYRLGAS